jgi:hypothetical protein
MKDRLIAIKPLLVALALFAQLALATAAATPAPQNTNSSSTTADKQNTNVGIPYNRKCRVRCERAYRSCVHGGKNATACRRQLRNCLRRCPQ